MRKRDPAFLFYPGDWLTDVRVRSMSFEERGIFLELLCIAWHEGGIPADLETLRAVLRLARARFAKAWERIGPCWVTSEGNDGVLVNGRQEHERAERRRKAEEMARRGAAGNRSRWQQDGDGDSQDGSLSDRTGVAHAIAQGSHVRSHKDVSRDRGKDVPAIAQGSPFTSTFTTQNPEKVGREGSSVSVQNPEGSPYRGPDCDPSAVVAKLAAAKAVTA